MKLEALFGWLWLNTTKFIRSLKLSEGIAWLKSKQNLSTKDIYLHLALNILQWGPQEHDATLKGRPPNTKDSRSILSYLPIY